MTVSNRTIQAHTAMNAYSEKHQRLANHSLIGLIALMLTNYLIHNEYFGYLTLAYAVYVSIVCQPVFLLIPCILSDTFQGFFMVSATLSFNRALAILFLVSFLLHNSAKIRLNKHGMLLVVMALYVLASSLWSIAGDFTAPIAFAITMLMLMSANSIDRMDFRVFFRIFVAAFTAFGLLLFTLTIMKSGGLSGSQVVFDESFNANTVSAAAGLSGCAVYGYVFMNGKEMKPYARLLMYGVICAAITTILLAGSRTSLISVICAIVFTTLIPNHANEKKRSAKRVIAGVFVLIVLCAVILFVMKDNTSIMNRFTFSRANAKDMYSIDRRFAVWEALCRHVIPEHPLLGVGFGLMNVKVAVAPYVVFAKHAHNMLLAILAETGLLGTALFAAFFCHYVKTFFRIRSKYASVVLAALLFAVTNGIGEEMINQRWMWLLFGLIDVMYHAQPKPVTNASDKLLH